MGELIGIAMIVIGCAIVIVWLRRRPASPLQLVRVTPRREPDRELDQLLLELAAVPVPVAVESRELPAVVSPRQFDRAPTPTAVLMPRIEAYIRDAMAAAGMETAAEPRRPKLVVGDTLHLRSLFATDETTVRARAIR
jgi:uncharacterized iron-regulated membrane protein